MCVSHLLFLAVLLIAELTAASYGAVAEDLIVVDVALDATKLQHVQNVETFFIRQSPCWGSTENNGVECVQTEEITYIASFPPHALDGFALRVVEIGNFLPQAEKRGDVEIRGHHILPAGWTAPTLGDLEITIVRPAPEIVRGFTDRIVLPWGEEVVYIVDYGNRISTVMKGVSVVGEGLGTTRRDGSRGNLLITVKSDWGNLTDARLALNVCLEIEECRTRTGRVRAIVYLAMHKFWAKRLSQRLSLGS